MPILTVCFLRRLEFLYANTCNSFCKGRVRLWIMCDGSSCLQTHKNYHAAAPIHATHTCATTFFPVLFLGLESKGFSKRSNGFDDDAELPMAMKYLLPLLLLPRSEGTWSSCRQVAICNEEGPSYAPQRLLSSNRPKGFYDGNGHGWIAMR